MMNLKFRIWILFLMAAAIVTFLQGVSQQLSLMNASLAGRPYIPIMSTFPTITPANFLPESSAEVRPESSAEVLPVESVDRELYAPTRYGIPEMLAGLEVVAVVSREQNPCMLNGDLLIMMHISEDVEETSLTQTLANAEAELKAINPNAIITGAGAMEDRDAFFARLDQNNRARQRDAAAGRCGEVFGGPSGVSGNRAVLFPTPTADTSFLNPESSAEVLPVDREKYSPARFGLPRMLGGFEIVAVVGGDTNPCTPADAIIVYLQGVDATYEDYQQGDTPENASMVLEELVKLYPKAAISIGSPIEDMEAFFRVLEEQRVNGQQAVANGGCVRIRSGPIILDPTYQMTAEAPVSEPFQMIATATPVQQVITTTPLR